MPSAGPRSKVSELSAKSGDSPIVRVVEHGQAGVLARTGRSCQETAQRPAGQHLSDWPFEVLRQTVRPLVVRRRNRCWDDVPRESR
jgi:hypothetical protein